MNPPIPPFDPLGLPLQVELLQGLAYLTFTLHLLAVHFTLGSLLLTLATWRSPHKAARFLGSGLPLGFSYLVTFGIPPLLFAQVIYGQFFYSSSILMGAFWISVIPSLIAAYGVSYFHKLTRDRRPAIQPVVLVLASLIVLYVGFLYANNLTLAQTPARWMEMYRRHSGGGSLNLAEPTLWPRYAFALSPSLAVAGLALILRGSTLRTWGQREEGAASHRLGLRAMLISAVFIAVAGGILATRLPASVQAGLRGPWAPLVLGAAIFAVLSLTLAWLSGKRDGRLLPILASVSAAGATACMVIVRDRVRLDYLRPYFDPALVASRPQWETFALFAGSLVAGLIFLIVFTAKTASGIAKAHRSTIANA